MAAVVGRLSALHYAIGGEHTSELISIEAKLQIWIYNFSVNFGFSPHPLC